MRRFLCIGFCSVLTVAAQVYVSPNGSDSNPGTRARPVASLERARDLTRTLNQNSSGDIYIYLAGTFRLTRPLALEPRDSGHNGHSIIWRAVAGERPVISGAVRITGWKLLDASRNLWAAAAPTTLPNTRQLYVNGIRAHRTSGRPPATLTQTASGYLAASPEMARWHNPSDIEFVYTGGNAVWSEPSVGIGSWTEPRCPVASISGTSIAMAQPCWDNSTKRVMLPNGARTANLVGPMSVGQQPAYIENAYELLGRRGEWYFDRTEKVIYYVPRLNENMRTADVEAPVLESLISAAGTPDAPVQNIAFKGITFSYATWLDPSTNEGFSEIQANYRLTGRDGYSKQGLCDLVPGGTCPYGNWAKLPGNLSFRFDKNIRFSDDVFVHLGAAGLDLGDGSQSDAVERCIFTDISGNGMELGGVDAPEAPAVEQTADNVIRNNHIFSVGAEYRDGIAIVVGYAKNTLIEHNQLDHLPYAAISMGWGGWPDKIARPGITNYSQGNRVINNLIFDFMLVLSDGGGIYTQGLTGPSLEKGELVAGNVVRDQFSTGHGIYTDNGSCNITVRGNLIFNTNFDNWGSRHKNYYDGHKGDTFDPLAIIGNYWQQGDADSSSGEVTVQGNDLISALADVPKEVIDHAGLQPCCDDLLKNNVLPASPPEPPSRVAAAWSKHSFVVTWSPPVSTGGLAVTSYSVESNTGMRASISPDEFARRSYIKLPGATAGQRYTFSVTATNPAGTSIPSRPSLPLEVTSDPPSMPGPPATVNALPGKGRASIHFQAPERQPGAHSEEPIIGYSVEISPGGRKVLFEGRRVVVLEGRHTTFDVVDGLESGRTYTFTVRAVTPDGEGAPATTKPVEIP
ncbi:MAG: right-handed parallel beta-helix repeat-containing protein [Acidobacteriaceae bacterium]|nr:right-handed parallel beta-helix repeat-containing protein [Acidobacteriaceae bacterium]